MGMGVSLVKLVQFYGSSSSQLRKPSTSHGFFKFSPIGGVNNIFSFYYCMCMWLYNAFKKNKLQYVTLFDLPFSNVFVFTVYSSLHWHKSKSELPWRPPYGSQITFIAPGYLYFSYSITYIQMGKYINFRPRNGHGKGGFTAHSWICGRFIV